MERTKNNPFRVLVIFGLLIIACPSLAWAQDTSLSGLIKDSETGAPLEFASVALLSPADSSVVTGSATDIKGTYQLKVEPGNYLMRVTFISYQTHYQSISVNAGKQKLAPITLSPDAVSLKSVEVVGERSRVTVALDKKMYNVGEEMVNVGGMASDALNNLPSITVDVEGNVSLRGSSNVRILINGKPSGLVGLSSNEALQSLPAELIERVEVITNPSARYDAQGQAGIINIILKEEKRAGWNGSANISGGYPWLANGTVNANYRNNGLNIFGLYGFRYRTNPGRGATERITYAPVEETLLQTQRLDRQDYSHTFRFGAEWDMDEFNSLSASIVYRLGYGNTLSTLNQNIYNAAEQLISSSVREGFETEYEPNIDYNLSYNRTFEEEDRSLSAQVQYGNSTEEERANITETEAILTDVDPLIQRSYIGESSENFLALVDYVHPIGEGTFETGYRGTMRNIGNDYIVEQQEPAGDWMTLPNQNDNLLFSENVQAAYVQYGHQWDKISFQGGLRAEYTGITITSEETGESQEKEFFNLFPSAFLTYQSSKENSWQLSYSRRIERPGFWQLNPFFSYLNDQNIRLGNPNLNPEFTDSYEAGYVRNGQQATWFATAYYRYTTGVIEYITEFENGVTTRRPVNLSTGNAYGLELGTSWDVAKWMRLDGDVNLFRFVTEGTYNGQEFYADAFSWSSRLNTNLKSDWVDGQIVFNYRAPRNTTQGRRLSRWNLDLVASRDFWDGNGTVALRVRDVFNTRLRRSETITDDFYQYSEFQWRTTQATVSFIYRLNQSDRDRRRDGRGDGDYDGGDEY